MVHRPLFRSTGAHICCGIHTTPPRRKGLRAIPSDRYSMPSLRSAASVFQSKPWRGATQRRGFKPSTRSILRPERSISRCCSIGRPENSVRLWNGRMLFPHLCPEGRIGRRAPQFGILVVRHNSKNGVNSKFLDNGRKPLPASLMDGRTEIIDAKQILSRLRNACHFLNILAVSYDRSSHMQTRTKQSIRREPQERQGCSRPYGCCKSNAGKPHPAH